MFQMTKMLDVLEFFLNLHGHSYLRLDGATGTCCPTSYCPLSPTARL